MSNHNEQIRQALYTAEHIFGLKSAEQGQALDPLMVAIDELCEWGVDEVDAELRVMEAEGLVELRDPIMDLGVTVFATPAGRSARELHIQSLGRRAPCLVNQTQFPLEDLIVALAAIRDCPTRAHYCLFDYQLPIYLHQYSQQECYDALDALIERGCLRQWKDRVGKSVGGRDPHGIALTAVGMRRYKEARGALAIPEDGCILDEPRAELNLDVLRRAVWILESAENDSLPADEYSQGTAFGLVGVGFVTCAHVLKEPMVAFHPSAVAKRYPVEVVATDSARDLAIVQFQSEAATFLPQARGSLPEQGDNIVLAGYPNYASGKNIFVKFGTVTSHFDRSAIRRFTISCPVVHGNSGGPVLDMKGDVVGVAYLGQPTLESAQFTDLNGVMPISEIHQLRPRHESDR